MFRKPKRKKAAGFRQRKTTNEDDEDDENDRREMREALKRAKQEHGGGGGGGKAVSAAAAAAAASETEAKKNVMHSFEDTGTAAMNQKDLATATVQHHPKAMENISKSRDEERNKQSGNNNEISKPKRNKFLAGPIRAPTNIRTTCRFDYQPDICKDYKDTGFCGFGDTCIYLHDRGDTMSGWQLEKVWEDSQKSKKKKQEEELERYLNGTDDVGVDADGNNKESKNNGAAASLAADDDDGIPFACFLCRKAFEDPIVTTCGHYFDQGCLQEHFVGSNSNSNSNNRNCPICDRDTHGVMNQPTKLIAKKRKLMGRKATWQDFMDSRGGKGAASG